MIRSLTRRVLGLAIAMAVADPTFAQTTLYGTGTFSYVNLLGVSADGRTAVGKAQAGGATNSVLWNPPGGARVIGPGVAAAASLDGSVVVGSVGPGVAFRWTAATGPQPLAVLPGLAYAGAAAVSADGSLVVGSCGISNTEPPYTVSRAVRWTFPAGAIEDLGAFPDLNSSAAAGVSADGTVVVGSAVDTRLPAQQQVYRAFRWTAAGGIQGLGSLGGASQATAVSADGRVVVGFAAAAGGYHAFRWTQEAGMQDLGLLPAGTYSKALATSGDGSVVVGVANSTTTLTHAVIWTAGTGLVDLTAYLGAMGVNTSGWILESATGISADGRVLVGDGRSSPNFEGWSLRITPPCYANCDGSITAPPLNVSDFVCFLNKYAAGDPYANCDGSTVPPILNVNDLVCFQARYAAGCP